MDRKIIKYFLLLLFFSFKVSAVEFNGKFIQGHFIIGKTDPNSKIKIGKKQVKVSKDGYFAFGLGRDRKYDVVITIEKDGVKKKITKKVQKRKYNIQRIDGLDEKQVTPPEEVYERIKSENKLIAETRAIETDLDFFKDKFIIPVDDAIITGVYGSQRILNGKPKWPHYGLDFAQKEGAPVKAMLDGIVTLAESDLYYTGGTLIFDHGHGISTLYMHMQKIFVKKGQKIKQGEVIGTVGSTGRATGAHLDIRLNWFGTRLDPATALKLIIMSLHFTKEEFLSRKNKVLNMMKNENLDALLMFRQESMYWLTGYDTFGYVFFQTLLLDQSGNIVLLTRAPDLRQAQNTSNIKDIRIWIDKDNSNPTDDLKVILDELNLKGKNIGVEYEAYGLTGRNAIKLNNSLKNYCQLEDKSDLISKLRVIKSNEEIVYVRKAAELADRALDEVWKNAKSRC